MPSIQCQECGKKLLPQKNTSPGEGCICSECGRDVYIRTETEVKVNYPKCGKENKTDFWKGHSV